MAKFLVTVALNKNEQMAAEADAEARFVARGRAAGRIDAIYVNPDKTLTWHVLDAEDEAAASAYIQTYPYAPWFSVQAVQAVVAIG